MSYARFGEESDVYVYASTSGFSCCGCSLTPTYDFVSRTALLLHLQQHIAHGDRVPGYALNRLRRELADEIVVP